MSIRFLNLLALLLIPSTFVGQDNVGDESTVRYPASYFSGWAPVTAQDMMDRIPGLSSGNNRGGFGGGGPPGSSRGGPPGSSRGGGSGGRGFGGGSRETEILINGKRTAGKNNSTGGQLTRIITEQVDYIEIIRGTSGDLDVRGSGQVINVVLFEELSESTLQYDFSGIQSDNNTLRPMGTFSYSGQAGGLGFQLSASALEPYFQNRSKENSVLGDFSPNDRILEESETKGTVTTLSSNLDYEINNGSSARFNALWLDGSGGTELIRNTIDLKQNPNQNLFQEEDSPSSQENWEVGGDYELISERGNRFKVLFISNSFTQATTRERFDILSKGLREKNLFLDSWNNTKERIVRGSYTFDIFEGQNIELGAERAQTILDSTLALGVAGSEGNPSVLTGGLIPVSLPNANSTVEEVRYEPFLIHNWIISSRMSLETSLLYENSEITQRGDVSKERNFAFAKPKVDFRYDLTPQLQLRGTIEKVVQQLTFNDFVAATDDQDLDSNVVAGNADLRQEWYWNYEVNAEYRLPNDIGVVSGRLYYEDWHDRIERMDVTVNENQLLSANGNIGDGEKYGLEVRGSVRMRMIDMPNLLVTATQEMEDSKIKDPFLGIDRRMLSSWRGRNTLGFRHDLPNLSLNYGLNWFNMFDGSRIKYDIDDIEYGAGDPLWVAFVEWVSPGNTVFRLDAQRIVNNGEFCRERQRFVGRISSGILEEIEDQCSTSGPVVSLRITGTF
ncbi:TonB-dependent receptor plug domain-containing protein [Gammaproteobacteria bacterium]|nr:TonB-dependent receptor plug domain-containing protein [Gammaproteobacteria bacterium]